MEILTINDYEFEVEFENTVYQGDFMVKKIAEDENSAEEFEVEVINISQCTDNTETNLIHTLPVTFLQDLEKEIEEEGDPSQWADDLERDYEDTFYDDYKLGGY